MLDLAIIGTLPSLGHHQPIGPFENLSLLLPSKDILFLTASYNIAEDFMLQGYGYLPGSSTTEYYNIAEDWEDDGTAHRPTAFDMRCE